MDLKEKTLLSSKVAEDKKAFDVVILDLKEYSSITDYFMICSGNSTRQVKAIADGIDENLSKKGIWALGIEGHNEARWILMDYGDLIIHIFYEETRKFYDLERLWGSAPLVNLE
ncbi:MAG TPA: ribosome silencing factor [Nitrospinota bacterium]|nr:ribosome silencing factor [Nitrospinota bacterium]